MKQQLCDAAQIVQHVSIALVAVLIVLTLPAALEAQQPGPSISHVSGDLYSFTNGSHVGVFLVTSEGIVLVDPLSTDTAIWLRAQLEERFEVPVRYVVYSHHHFDHVEGGAIFADTARFVAQENMLEAMHRGVAQTLPGGSHDANANAVLERGEAVTGIRTRFDRLDRNGDGVMTGEELFAEVYPPDEVYADRLTMIVGGQTIDLMHPGPNHAPDMSVVQFRGERAVFAVDFVSVQRLPGGFGVFDRTPLSSWIVSLRAVEALDFDILIAGHGPRGTKTDVVDQRRYFEDLRTAVATGIAARRSVQQLQQTVRLAAYRDWAGYEDNRAENIRQAYFNLRAYP